MKCPNCGAEIGVNNKFCESCGSQISYGMKREQEQLNKEGCPKCGSSNTTFTREKHGEIKGKSGTSVVIRTVGVCKDCGHTWFTDSGQYEQQKKSSLILWILGWLFFFPAPIMVLIWRKKNTWNTKIKIAVTIAFWLVFFIIGLSDNKDTTSTENESTVDVVSTTTTIEEKVAPTVSNENNTSENVSQTTSNIYDTTGVVEEAPSEAEKTPEELYFEQLKQDTEWQMMPRDECKNISLEDRTLTLEIYLTRKDRLSERCTDIADAILAIESGYDWWDTLVLDFGSFGVITKTKDDLVDGHFEIANEDFIKNE